jgi:hypothetical protein
MLLNTLKSPNQVFLEEGILFYPQIFEGEELARLRAASENVLDQYRADLQANNPADADIATTMRHLNDSRWHRERRDHWKVIMEAIADPRCLGPVEQIFRGRSLFFTTSLFFNPRTGTTEGNWHRDHQFILPSEEEVKAHYNRSREEQQANMDGIQFQIALVDNEDVEYVPYSPGRYDSPQEYYIRCADDRSHNREDGMPNAMRIHQRAGDAIIFNPAGLHRGRYHAASPRRTLMLTYSPHHRPIHNYFTHQPWMLEPGYLDDLSPRARVYFEDFIDQYQSHWHAQLAGDSNLQE